MVLIIQQAIFTALNITMCLEAYSENKIRYAKWLRATAIFNVMVLIGVIFYCA